MLTQGTEHAVGPERGTPKPGGSKEMRSVVDQGRLPGGADPDADS